uniref:Uncharacterized protein n=1 Tax=Arundo donax TaxID=35708 RepID=A0A0A9E517_ARUDO
MATRWKGGTMCSIQHSKTCIYLTNNMLLTVCFVPTCTIVSHMVHFVMLGCFHVEDIHATIPNIFF